MLLFAGAVTLRPPDPSEKEGRTMRCDMLNPCVTVGSGISATFVIDAASGVPTKKDCP